MRSRTGRMQKLMVSGFTKLDSRWLPFADAATVELPLGRCAAAWPVSTLGWHGGRAAYGNAQQGHDRGVARPHDIGGDHGFASAACCTVSRVHGLPDQTLIALRSDGVACHSSGLDR